MYRPRDLPTDGWHDKPLLASLVAAAFIILAPGLLFAAWYANSWAASERERIEQTARHAVSGLTAAVDRHLTASQSLLVTLASSPSLQTGDLAGFYRQASQISQTLGVNIVLRDLESNRQVIHTAFAMGDALLEGIPKETDLAAQRLLETGKPQVSGVFLGRRLDDYVVVVMAPVSHENKTRYVLSVVLRAWTIANILRQSNLDPTWVAVVIDENGATVARSRRHQEFVGKSIHKPMPAVASYSAKILDTAEPAKYFFEPSKVAQWRVIVGVPQRALTASSQWAFGNLAIASTLFLLAAGVLAHRLAGRLSHRMGALQTAAIVERKLGEEQFQALAESVSNGIAAVDSADNIVFLNAQIETMFAYSRDELIGRSADILFPARFVARIAGLRRELRTLPQSTASGADHELTGLRKDGTEFPIKVGLSLITTSSGQFLMVTLADLTAQHQVVERLSAILVERDDLRRRLMQAQEQERLRLARDLHDQTGQVVVAAMMELKGIEPFVDADGRKRIHHLRKQLDKMGKALHRIAWELRPASIDEVGLAETLTDYVAEWSSQFGIAAELICSNKRQLSVEISTTIYRIVQEALTNTAKHARDATAVSVIVDISASELRLTIDDNGCGFDAEATTAEGKLRRGLGLDGVRERVSLIGGAVEVESAVGVGTTLYIRIPLEPQRMIA
ncbi:MAG TPA: ATP-binding protein [Hyphomicrobiaceae bacterium]|nr:ATP-binding protein [Hyphomicrobiaceae bacterium]